MVASPSSAPVAAPATAPQNEDWNNVSHINGTLVPVGDRGRYLYSFKKTEITVNPFAAFFGYYDGGAAHALTQNIAVAGSITGWNMDHGNSSGYQLTASVPVYFRQAFSGAFLEPGMILRESSSNDDGGCYYSTDSSCSSMTTTHRWVGPEMLLGWQSTFDSGMTVQAAFGVAKRITANWDDASDGVDVNGYFRVGYAF